MSGALLCISKSTHYGASAIAALLPTCCTSVQHMDDANARNVKGDWNRVVRVLRAIATDTVVLRKCLANATDKTSEINLPVGDMKNNSLVYTPWRF